MLATHLLTIPGLTLATPGMDVLATVDLELIGVDLLLGLTGVPASYWDALPFYNTPPLQNYPYDPEGAKKMLEADGWIDSNGDGVRDVRVAQLVDERAIGERALGQLVVRGEDALDVGVRRVDQVDRQDAVARAGRGAPPRRRPTAPPPRAWRASKSRCMPRIPPAET